MKLLPLPQRLRGLRAQLLLWTILPLTLVLIAIAFTGVYSHQHSMRSLIEDRDRVLAQVYAAQVEEILHRRSDALRILSFHTDPLQYVGEDVSLLFDGGIAIFSPTARLIAAWPSDEGWAARLPRLISLASGQDMMTEPRFSPLFDDSALEEPTLLVAVRRRGKDEILAGAVSLSHLGLDALLTQTAVGQHGGMIYLIDQDGVIQVHPDAAHCGTDATGHSGIRQALATPTGSTECLSPGGKRMIVSYATVGPIGWHVIVEEPWEAVTAPVLRYSQAVPFIATAAALISLLALYFTARYVARPLQILSAQAGHVTWGDFSSIGEPVGGVQEIEDLRQALEEMAGRIKDHEDGMRDYIAAITQGQESERTRLARELHDDTAQALIALGQRLEMARRALGRGNVSRGGELLVEAKRLAAEALEGVRRFSRDLRPVYLDDLGFVPALEMLVRDLNQTRQVEARFEVTGEARRLDPSLELAAYRIVQEALNNALQHAAARRVYLRVAFDPDMLTITVEDDGIGFTVPEHPGELTREGHFGLVGMIERAILFGGRLRVNSSPGQGTALIVQFPLAS